MKRLLCLAVLLVLTLSARAAEPLKVLLIDGQNNHDWKTTSPILQAILEETKLFKVDRATAPGGQDLSSFSPNFADYAVVVSNYNGALWSPATQEAFEKYVSGGGGFASVHAANNSFPEWKAYNEMIGLGGWNGRNEKSGPYLRLRDGKWTPDPTPGNGGSHGQQHDFLMTNRAEHPITAGLPPKWMHVKDELYDRLRGPAKDVIVLASAMADKAKGGSGEEEPLLFAIPYGKGRVFHTALGHGTEAIKCVGFATTLQRGTEWAATGKVTQKLPESFPSETKTSSRP